MSARGEERSVTCVGCGCEIPAARLRAMPLAEFCVDCQAERDVPIRPEQVADAMAEAEIEAGQLWPRKHD